MLSKIYIFAWLSLCLLVVLPISAQELVWEQTNGPYGGNITALLATPDGTLFAGTSRGVFRSDNKGDSWISAGLMNFEITSLAVIDTTLFASTYNKVFRSEDRGNSWNEVNIGLKYSTGSYLAVLDATLFVGIPWHGVFRSQDRGNSWNEVNIGWSDASISSFAILDKTFFLGTSSGSGVFRSEDGGNIWTLVRLPKAEVRSLAVLGTTLFAGALFFSELPARGAIFRSNDGGNSWTPIRLTKRNVASLKVLGTTLFAAASDEGVLRSDDEGNTWTVVNIGLTNPNINSFAVIDTTIFAATEGGGVFRSEDMGNTWMAVNTGLINHHINSLAVLGATLFAGASFLFGPKGSEGGGVFRSEDMGNTWTAVNTGLTNHHINSLAVLGTMLFAGSGGGGVFRASLAGLTPVAVEQKGKSFTAWGKIKTALLQNYPNPFNPETWIPFSLAEDSEVTIRIYDIKGQLVKALNLGHKERGLYLSKEKAAHWDGRNERGELVASGIYFVKLKTEGYQQVKRIVLLK